MSFPHNIIKIDKSAEHCFVIEPKYNNKNEPNAGIKAFNCPRNAPVNAFFLLAIFAPLESTVLVIWPSTSQVRL